MAEQLGASYFCTEIFQKSFKSTKCICYISLCVRTVKLHQYGLQGLAAIYIITPTDVPLIDAKRIEWVAETATWSFKLLCDTLPMAAAP